MQKRASDSIANAAKEQALELTKSLGLTTKQTLLVEDKLTEFLIYEKDIKKARLTPEQEAERFRVLRNSKFSEMREILTRKQYERYVTIK